MGGINKPAPKKNGAFKLVKYGDMTKYLVRESEKKWPGRLQFLSLNVVGLKDHCFGPSNFPQGGNEKP